MTASGSRNVARKCLSVLAYRRDPHVRGVIRATRPSGRTVDHVRSHEGNDRSARPEYEATRFAHARSAGFSKSAGFPRRARPSRTSSSRLAAFGMTDRRSDTLIALETTTDGDAWPSSRATAACSGLLIVS